MSRYTILLPLILVVAETVNVDGQLPMESTWPGSLRPLSAIPSNPPSIDPTISAVPSETPSSKFSNRASEMPSDFPSRVPSDLPSLIPSAYPSNNFIFHGNAALSATPSSMSSSIPSDFPSLTPSGIPSKVASDLPSDLPSTIPSILPSTLPSTRPSGIASQQPSTVPSALPSLYPSSSPSISPTSSPSFTPTSEPSLLPSTDPTGRPSASPSRSPSFSPSSTPSDAPTTSPSSTPTSAPSASPSAPPTHHPTLFPTSFPTNLPTDLPTRQPSSSPSSSPSSAPTETCHDVRGYRSAINEFSCEDHRGTDCIRWRYLGLSIDGVESLIENCPVSCGVECGTSLRFETIFSFKLWNVDRFLSPDAVETMNKVAIEFMTDYVSSNEPEGQFFVYETVLLSQQIAGNQPTRRLRYLQDSSTDALLVDVEFRGYAIKLDQVAIESRLREGLFSSSFTNALQRSGEATFKDIQVGAVGSSQPIQTKTQESGRGSSPAGISAAILGSVAIVAAAAVFFFRNKRVTDSKKQAFERENQVNNNFPASPIQSVLSPASSFSLEGASNLVSRMTRIVTSFSPRSSNYDDDDGTKAELTNSESSQSNGENVAKNLDVDLSQEMIEEGSEREDSLEEYEEEEEIHPYTGIIPPMIVIDRIESDLDIYVEDEEQFLRPRKVRSVVPSMRLEASSDLVAALNDRSKPFDPETFTNFIHSKTPTAFDTTNQRPDEFTTIQGSGSSFNLFSSVEDDDASTKASNPDSSEAVFDRLRKSGSSECDEGVVTGSVRLDLRGRQLVSFPSMARPPRVPSEGSGPTQRSSPRSANTSPVISRDKSTADGYFSDDNAAKEQVSRREVPTFLNSLWSKSPRSRGGPKSDTSSESIKRWGSHRRSGSKGSYGTLGSLDEDGTVLTFHAPKGQLGLIIECSSESPPIIAKVKDYSPLLDQVVPGDKIIMIDSTFTDKIGMSEVMSLLEGNKSSRATSVRLKVFRANEGVVGRTTNQARSPTVSHLSYDGTSSLGTMSDQESPIHFGQKMESKNPPINLAMPSGPPTMRRSHSEAEIY